MKLHFKNILFNPWLQSVLVGALVTLLLIMIWDAPIKKYKVSIDPQERYTTDDVLWYFDDFDSDGNSEWLRVFNEVNKATMDLVAYDESGNLLEHYHYRESNWDLNLTPRIFDLDGNGIKELIYFSIRNDSIFFNAINLLTYDLFIDHLYFNSFERKSGSYAFSSEFLKFGDFNNDHVNELFFVFDAGYGLYPRGVFKIEFPSLKIIASPTDHMVIFDFNLHDLNKDGIPEILCNTNAPDNSTDKHKLSDTCSYITVLDYNLQPIFDPIPMNAKYSSVRCIPNTQSDSTFFASFYCRSGSNDSIRIMELSSTGKILIQKKWHNFQNPDNISIELKIINNLSYLLIQDLGRFNLNDGLDKLPGKLELVNDPLLGIPLVYDFDGKNPDELFFRDLRSHCIILNDKTNDMVQFDSPLPLRPDLKIYPVLKDGEVTYHAVTERGGFFFIDYYRNPKYFVLFLIYFFVFLLGTGMIRLLFYFQKKNIEKKWQTEKQLTELQFNAVKNQLNPHFLFNSLNSVALMINEGKNDEAYDFLSLNARMIQRVMDDASQIIRSVQNEIQFTRDYLNIQKRRFKERFNFKIVVSPEVDLSFEVPKMCIHTYVENSIKHGFRNIKKGGLLLIEISPLYNGVRILISDNGMGRNEAGKYKDSSGNGIKIMNEFYCLFEKYHGYQIHFSITDNTSPTKTGVGTIVELKIQNR